eukprot:5027839-Pleurochrysis_carterae.AAC.2
MSHMPSSSMFKVCDSLRVASMTAMRPARTGFMSPPPRCTPSLRARKWAGRGCSSYTHILKKYTKHGI